jgi:uncharacterized protein (TIGR02271 family)
MANRADEITPGTVAGYFRDDDIAQGAVQQLEDAGFSKQQIAIFASEEHTGFFARMASSFRGVRHASNEEMDEVLLDTGMPTQDAEFFASRLRQGGKLLLVHADQRVNEAYEILKHAGAVSGTGTKVSPTVAGQPLSPETGMPGPASSEEQRILLHREELTAGKEKVQTGEVRVRKEVVTETQSVQVPVSREEVVIERRPATGETEGTTGEIKEGKEIRIPVSEERARVEKTTVPTEEVSIGKREVQNVETVSEPVKKEEVKIEGEGAVRRERPEPPEGKKVA